jgi:ribosomal protein S12 methylthiotransferase accessory factor
MPPLADLFRAAAAALTGEAVAEAAPRDLLACLDYLDDARDQAPHRAALLRAAAGFVRFFTLSEPDAPGLFACGAEVDPSRAGTREAPPGSVSGTGLTFRQAFESCVGEGVEYLSRFAADDGSVVRLTAAEALDGASTAIRELWNSLRPCLRDPASPLTAWTIAADLASGQPVCLPADLCVTRPPGDRDLDPPWPLSIGCAAGQDHLSATLHGLLELIERDAVALWWLGGRRARLPPPGTGASVLARLRGGETRRRTWFLDVTNDSRVPVVVAASCDDGGFGLCCGFAARPTLAGAAEAAAREMAQMELAHRIAAAKRAERGEDALNEADRLHLRRFATVDVARTPALQPLAPPSASCDLAATDPLTALGEARKRLAAIGLAPCALNLTRAEFGIPVVRVVCPGLEIGLGAPPGPRLRDAAEASGADPAAAMPL